MVASIVSSKRTTRQIANVNMLVPPHPVSGFVELDSHADTCCAGSNCTIIEQSGRTCNVIGFNRNNPNSELTDIPIVKAATAYDSPTGETYIIVIPQALYLGEHLDYTLLCPNQLRHNGVIVDDVPRHLAPDPEVATHDARIPLELHGVISGFPTRTPTPDEIENCKWLILTSDLEWDPHSLAFAERENQINNDMTPITSERNIFSLQSTYGCKIDNMLSDISPVFSDHQFLKDVQETTLCTHNMAIKVASTATSHRSSAITKEHLSKIWGIGLHTASQTLRVTTQKGIRNAVHPITRRYATKQSRLRYNQLGSQHGRFYSDTFFASSKSTRGNSMAQMFVNDIKYMRIFPMKKKSEAGNTLLELIQDIGIPASL